MNGNPNIAEIASLLADSSRAEILISLMDGRYHYYQLANQEIARILESFLTISRPVDSVIKTRYTNKSFM